MRHKCGCCGRIYEGREILFCKLCLERYTKPPIHEEVKACAICGKLFSPTQPKKKYCSDECATEGQRRRTEINNHKISEKRRQKKKQEEINTVWWKTYKRADKLGKECMLARRNNMTYGQLQVAISEGKLNRKDLEDAARREEIEKQEG